MAQAQSRTRAASAARHWEGQNIPDDKKSIAIRVTLQPEHSTFTDQEIETIRQIDDKDFATPEEKKPGGEKIT